MEINFRQIITLKLISSNYHNTYVRLERDNTVLVIIFSVCRFMNCIRVHFHDLIIINKRLIIEFRQHDCYLSMSIIDTQNRRRVETSTRRIIVNLNLCLKFRRLFWLQFIEWKFFIIFGGGENGILHSFYLHWIRIRFVGKLCN